MCKKLFSIIVVMTVLGTLYCGIPAAAQTNLVVNGSFEELNGDGTLPTGNISISGGASVITTGGAQDGDNYVSLESGSLNVSVSVKENTSYKVTFWVKTSAEASLSVRMYPFTSRDGWYDWTTYCNNNDIEYVHGGECTTEFNTGITQAGGSDWMKTGFEFHVPHDCTTVVIYISGRDGTTDPFRAVDNISLVELEEENLVKNGSFDSTLYGNIGAYNLTQAAATGWMFHPSEHYNGKFSYTTEANGNNYVQLQPGPVGDWRGVVLYQTLYLYTGDYELSFKRRITSGSGVPVSLVAAAPAATNYNSPRHVMNVGGTVTEGWESYKVCLTVTTKGQFNLTFGNVWFHGEHAYDDVKLTRVSDAAVSYGTAVSKYVDTDGDTDFKYTPVTASSSAQTVQAYGWVSAAAASESVKLLHAVYKIVDGDRILYSVAIQNVTPGTAFVSENINVPAVTGEESYKLETLVWDSLENLRPIAEKTIY